MKWTGTDGTSFNCGMRWKNFDKKITEEGHKVSFTGKDKEDKHGHGIGFFVHRDIMNVTQTPAGSSHST